MNKTRTKKNKVTKVKEQNNDQVADAAAAEPAASNHFILKAASFWKLVSRGLMSWLYVWHIS